ncbi:MAG: hypothetical protein R3C18_09520 [Planctomycetaceae bacterium]
MRNQKVFAEGKQEKAAPPMPSRRKVVSQLPSLASPATVQSGQSHLGTASSQSSSVVQLKSTAGVMVL